MIPRELVFKENYKHKQIMNIRTKFEVARVESVEGGGDSEGEGI